jgi:hypothetical protein
MTSGVPRTFVLSPPAPARDSAAPAEEVVTIGEAEVVGTSGVAAAEVVAEEVVSFVDSAVGVDAVVSAAAGVL